MGTIEKPKLLKVFGRSHYACTRCKYSKIKCSGQKPCSNCKNINMAEECVYPAKDRKVMIMESDLDKLHERLEELERRSSRSPGSNEADENERVEESERVKKEQVRLRESFFEKRLRKGQDLNEYIDSCLQNDIRKRVAPSGLYEICRATLPAKEYTFRMIQKVQVNYSSEFYLIDVDYINVLVEKAYAFFEAYNDYEAQDLTMSSGELCYLFIIIAFGEQISNSSQNYSGSTSEAEDEPGLRYYILSVELFNICTEQLTLQYIQSATLLALFSANITRYNIVYNFIGIAMRSCLAKGYHRQVELTAFSSDSHELSLINREKSKRLFWSVLVIETTWSANRMSLPVHIDYIDTDVDLPSDNSYDLQDSFDLDTLEVNVHLAKYVAQFLRLIYGPNIRTLSINYINTVQFNRKALVKNILECFDDIVKNFEEPYLSKFDRTSVLEKDGRILGNLFLRYHQLIIILTKPLLCMVLKNFLDLKSDNSELDYVISKGIEASLATIDIISTFHANDKLFTLGYWDSQHLFSAMTIILLSAFAGKKFTQFNKGIFLLRHMRDGNNINAVECWKKLQHVSEFLSNAPTLKSRLSLDDNLLTLNLKSDFEANYRLSQFYEEHIISIGKSKFDFKSTSITKFDSQTHSELCSLINFIQGWDDNRNFTNKFT